VRAKAVALAWHADCLERGVTLPQTRVVKRIDIMPTQAPDIARHFGAEDASSADQSPRDDEVARAQEAELEQLAERVSAARSVY
jgi:hypothetical protein